MSVRTPEMADKIMKAISEGVTLRQFCRENAIGKSEVYRWRDEDADFRGRFARARDEGFDAIAEGTIDIADDQDEEPASRKVRIETRLKLLAKWDPRRYGDRLIHAGDADNPVAVTTIERTIVDPKEK